MHVHIGIILLLYITHNNILYKMNNNEDLKIFTIICISIIKKMSKSRDSPCLLYYRWCNYIPTRI